MQRLGSILVILDKPKHAQAALERACVLAAASGAQLHLVAFCWLVMAEQPEVFDASQRRALRQSVRSDREAWLQGRIAEAALTGAAATGEVVWTEDIAGWVAAQAAVRKPDLVMKTVHRSRTLMHTPLDWQLLRSCPAPLYLVSGTDRPRAGNVLATIDLRHTDRKHQLLNLRVLEMAGIMTGLERGKLHCVHVIEGPTDGSGFEMIAPARFEREMKARAREYLAALLSPYGVPRSRVHLPVGKVGAAVAAVAGRVSADLVIVGTSARRGLGAILLGNSAEKILTRLDCDVLAVHPGG